MPDYLLELYVTGTGSRSERAIRETQRMCEEHFGGSCRLVVVDVREQPQVAAQQRILATPTLIRVLPGPARRVVGDLSDHEKVEVGLGLPAGRRALRTRAFHP